jgi:hypothetical protein
VSCVSDVVSVSVLFLLFTLVFIFLVYPMLPVSLCCSFLIAPSVYSSDYFVLYFVYPMLSDRIHKTQDKIITRVNRRNNTKTLTTSDTQETGQNKHYSKQKEQHRDTDNIGYTKYKTK